MSSREDRKPCAQEGSDKDHEDGRDADADATVEVVLGGTGGHVHVALGDTGREGRVASTRVRREVVLE